MVKFSARKIAYTALMTATLEAGIWALKIIPNFEIITTLLFVYTFVFGFPYAFIAANAFTLIEGMVWGFNPTWWIGFAIQWNAVVFVAWLACKFFRNNELAIALLAVAVTIFYGIQSSLFQLIFISDWSVSNQISFAGYMTIYIAGIVFYIIQIVGNFVLILFVHRPVVNALQKIPALN